jgi:hypothetical protein
MSNHPDPIPNDFNADLAYAGSDATVHVHIGDAYLHFLVRTKYEQGYSILSQYYYPRLFLSLFRAWRNGFCALDCVSESHFAKPVLPAVGNV